MKRISKVVATVLLGAAVVVASPVQAQGVTIKAVPVSGPVHMLMGKGGNVGVLVGDDGTVMIDDQFAPLTASLLDAIKQLGGAFPKFVINTHMHGDHTGGNANLGKAGTTLVAHANVRKRLAEGATIKAFNMKMAPYAEHALPQITFTKDTTFHLNGETVHVFHAPNAHTDGDGVVHFVNANVIHAGDLFFNGFYPFIDPDNGGSLRGMIKAADAILARTNADTKIIPGHGPLATVADFEAYRDMLTTARTRLAALKQKGQPLSAALLAKPLADLDEKWSKGIFPTDKWISLIYDSIATN